MFRAMTIPRKLAVSFLVLCASAAAMMLVFYSSFDAIRRATDSSNTSQTVLSKLQTLETSILRQNSQFRGFMVTADPTYLKSYREARAEYDSTYAAVRPMLSDPEMLRNIDTSQRETLAWRRDWGDRLIALVERGGQQQAQQMVRDAGQKVMTSKAVLPLRAVRDYESKLLVREAERQAATIHTGMKTLVIGGIALIAIAILLAVLLSRTIARPITRLTGTMAELAIGRHDVEIQGAARSDELGDMARAVLVFRDAAVAKQVAEAEQARHDAEQKRVVDTLSAHLSRVSGGDLTSAITTAMPPRYAKLKEDFNETLSQLRALIGAVSDGALAINGSSNEIAQASEDLARRTESAAASLERTSSAVSQVEARLKQTTEAARRSAAGSGAALLAVRDGRGCATQAVQAMERVSASAKGIDTVIEGLDKIAFQTRVLAMNAAVEAGRAGDAGRGFAVVADLVSALAMRAEEEAKNARNQLTTTQSDIGMAVNAVGSVDRALGAISDANEQASTLAEHIAADNEAQSTAIGQIAAAITAMDRTIQQNAAMVEQTSATARQLTGEVGELTVKASRFDTGRPASTSRTPVAARHAAAEPVTPARSSAQLADADAWLSF
ncbi:methyl-accepting chemotaxis protein [Sphingomonas sp. SORGH_AS802]|uniref:HAMP domain-containing methyl-accepting chemotaxis protein n=1 Tax=unclassified Sphingomonas TaxID=196159 RepID=UPI00285A5824|nr:MULTISPECIES: methyl-accepting chemotaxis protein [unclassified Sphingomonas]MDR6126663.1 methyl-accepting chemotaxis protein [Sphingomonas sp. SORGH_AS_0438]MDR6134969.1 methyl-accepting chemotaxis protein [Sphingomonas sp. SORGH_AS_0802]